MRLARQNIKKVFGNTRSMGFMAMAMVAFGLTTCFMSTAESAPCPLDTVVIKITSTAEVQNLTDALACVGKGIFNITWHSTLTIDEGIEVADEKTMTVTGDALGDNNTAGVIVDAGSGTGIFSVSNGSTLRLNNIGLEGGIAEDGGAVAVISSSSLFVFSCTFTRNTASNGGALFASNSSIYIDGSTLFKENTAQYGGSIYANSSEIGIDGNTSFTDNSARVDGGVIFAESSGIGIDGNASFTNNSAEDDGGAVYAYSSELGIDGVAMFTHNSAGQDGGAVYVLNGSEVGINGDAMFTYNSANHTGGAVHVRADSELAIDGDVTCTFDFADQTGGSNWTSLSSGMSIDGNATFTSNSAVFGGAVHVSFSELGIDGNASFTNNSASDDGGAVYTCFSEFGIDGNALFTKNSAVEDAGAVFAAESNVSLNGNTQFSSNSALKTGGAIKFTRSVGSIDGNATFTSNPANSGGALYVAKSEFGIDGNAMFTNNSARLNGGAIRAASSNFTISGSKILRDGLPGNEGGWYSDAGGDYTSSWSVVFANNSADAVGGAIAFETCDQVHVGDTMFKSNKASLGGAVSIFAVDDKPTFFSECLLEGNTAEDGGALYLYTGPGVDIFNASVFKNNFAWTSGGAIFHTGSMRVSNTIFVANEAVIEGPAIMSVGFLGVMSNVNFSENAYYCPIGEYGYIETNETQFCSSCFEEVCSRCSTFGDAVSTRQEVRIDGKPVCAESPVGATAPLPGTTIETLTLQKGFFRTSNESRDILQCYRKGACHGGTDTDKYCTSGYTGPYCAVCAKDFAPGIAYSCRECSRDMTRSAVGLAVVVGLAVLLLAGALLSYLGKVVHDGAEEGIEINQSQWKRKFRSCRDSLVNMLPIRAIKIVVTVWQIISQFDAIAGDVYPELYQNFVSKLNPINLDLDFIFSYSCLVSNDFYDHLVFATITPLLALVVLAGSYFIGKKRNSCSESAIREVRNKHQAVVLFIAFFVYSPVSYRIFQTFGCDELDNGKTYLRADYSIFCLTARHSWYKVYALMMVAVYPIGITAGFTVLLVWHRRDLVKPDRETMLHLKPLNGVWAAYKPSRYYYEVVECGRRIALTVIAAFVLPNSTTQLSTALLFAVAYVFISEILSPFQKGIDMGLYRWGNGIIVASMYVAFLSKIDVDETTASAEYLLTFSGVLIAANIFMVVTVLVQTVLLTKEMHRNKIVVRVGPVRRTGSVSLRDLRSVYEGGVCREEGTALEFKDCDI